MSNDGVSVFAKRAEVMKTLVEAEKIKVETGKMLAEAETEKLNSLISQLSGVIPELSKLQKNTVTFSEGKVFRQAEVIAAALPQLAKEIADEVMKCLPYPPGATTLFITSEFQLVAAIAKYRQIVDEIGQLKSQLIAGRQAKTLLTRGALASNSSISRAATRARRAAIAQRAMVALAPAIGKTLTEVASLFETDTTVTSSSTGLPKLVFHAAVINALLAPHAGRTTTAELSIQHEWTSIPAANSPMREAMNELDTEYRAAQAALAELLSHVEMLRDTKDESWSPPKGLETAQINLEAAIARTNEFANRIGTVSKETGLSPLVAAYHVEPLADLKDGAYVLVLGDATAESNQVTVTRRLLFPRLHITATVEAHYFLLNGGGIIAAGHPSVSRAYTTNLGKSNSEWHRTDLPG